MGRLSVLMIFVDGLGMGGTDMAVNPLADAATLPLLYRICMRDAVPVDACLGVPGIPQSATGQTALLTGVNAAAVLGRHQEGFPDKALRHIIKRENIFLKLWQSGCKGIFANAYRTTDYDRMRHHSVTTVAARDSHGGFRNLEQLKADAAVYQDITNRLLQDGGYGIPERTPEQAGTVLAALAARYNFTLFEYFQTDRAAHRGGRDAVMHVLATFERFIGAVLDAYDPVTTLLLIISDHGNIEDLSIKHHTCNPVPLFAAGRYSDHAVLHIRSLADVTPVLLELLAADKLL